MSPPALDFGNGRGFMPPTQMAEKPVGQGPRHVATRGSPQMTLRKCAAGTGFQILLELDCATLFSERDDDDHFPGPSRRGVMGMLSVVLREAQTDVGRQPGVVPGRVSHALQDVDEPLRGGHTATGAIHQPAGLLGNLEARADSARERCRFWSGSARQTAQDVRSASPPSRLAHPPRGFAPMVGKRRYGGHHPSQVSKARDDGGTTCAKGDTWLAIRSSPEGRAKDGEPRRNRTVNPQIKSLLLCQLS
jgi:hypothetical protein